MCAYVGAEFFYIINSCSIQLIGCLTLNTYEIEKCLMFRFFLVLSEKNSCLEMFLVGMTEKFGS